MNSVLEDLINLFWSATVESHGLAKKIQDNLVRKYVVHVLQMRLPHYLKLRKGFTFVMICKELIMSTGILRFTRLGWLIRACLVNWETIVVETYSRRLLQVIVSDSTGENLAPCIRVLD